MAPPALAPPAPVCLACLKQLPCGTSSIAHLGRLLDPCPCSPLCPVVPEAWLMASCNCRSHRQLQALVPQPGTMSDAPDAKWLLTGRPASKDLLQHQLLLCALHATVTAVQKG